MFHKLLIDQAKSILSYQIVFEDTYFWWLTGTDGNHPVILPSGLRMLNAKFIELFMCMFSAGKQELKTYNILYLC